MNINKINEKTVIFPEIIPLIIPDFEKHNLTIVPKVLSFTKKKSTEWFEEFVSIVESKIGKEYYPIIRMSDGEYLFILGDVPPVNHADTISYLKSLTIYYLRKLKNTNTFKAATLPGVSSGIYTKSEIEKIMTQYAGWLKTLAEKGVLALHLTYSKKSFQDKFHHHLKRWLDTNNIVVNEKNYYPFYFVYALLRGSAKGRILSKRRILIVHSANGEKRKHIIKALYNEGVMNIEWLEISSSRSLYDKIDVDKFVNKVDLVLLGAGVGKPNIMVQLEKLKIPCIDAGFAFEVWAAEENKWKRPVMVPDNEWDITKINFL